MNYALGCAFNLKDIFHNFNYKKLETNCSDCYKLIKDNHRFLLACKIFTTSVKLILDDVIQRNVTFWLPLTGNRKCNIHMKRVLGKDFQKLRQVGKWADIDIVKSFFSGYEIGFYMLGNRTPRVKTIYVNKLLKDTITLNTNAGKQYGDSVIDTTIKDYIEKVSKEFPLIPIKDIKTILVFAWKSVYLHNSYGGDTLIKSTNLWCYIGQLKRTAIQHFQYYLRKLIIKVRVNYKRKGSPWDGFYYFALSESEYQKYLKQKNIKGRPKKWFTFEKVFVYEILDECLLKEFSKKYIFRYKLLDKISTRYYYQKLQAQVELLKIRAPLKFKDILTSNNK